MFLCVSWSASNSFKVHLEGIAIKRSETHVVKILCLQVCWWFKTLHQNECAISVELYVSCGELTFGIMEQFPGLRIVFRAVSLVPILLVVSHPASAGRHCVSLSPSAVQMSWKAKLIFSPPSYAQAKATFLQLTVKWYNRHTKTCVSPDEIYRSWVVTYNVLHREHHPVISFFMCTVELRYAQLIRTKTVEIYQGIVVWCLCSWWWPIQHRNPGKHSCWWMTTKSSLKLFFWW